VFGGGGCPSSNCGCETGCGCGATAAAVGRVVKTPEYLNIVSKPIDQATQAQMNRFERLWPRVLKMEQDRYRMIKEDLEK
jgi:hypothetical protein